MIQTALLQTSQPQIRSAPLGRAESATFTARLLARDDADRDGRLSQAEARISAASDWMMPDFTTADSDGDGLLSGAEMRHFADSLPPGLIDDDAGPPAQRAAAFRAALAVTLGMQPDAPAPEDAARRS